MSVSVARTQELYNNKMEISLITKKLLINLCAGRSEEII